LLHIIIFIDSEQHQVTIIFFFKDHFTAAEDSLLPLTNTPWNIASSNNVNTTSKIGTSTTINKLDTSDEIINNTGLDTKHLTSVSIQGSTLEIYSSSVDDMLWTSRLTLNQTLSDTVVTLENGTLILKTGQTVITGKYTYLDFR
jgi:hypothetical protein